MNSPWLPVFNTIVLIAHTQSMWQVAVNPFSSFLECLPALQPHLFVFVSKCVSHFLLYLKCLGFLQHSTPSLWQCQSQLSGCPNRESQKHRIPVNKCSISAAFMWSECGHKRLDCQGTWTDGTKQCKQVKQYAVIQPRGTNPHNEPCIPMCIICKVQPHKANYWLSFSFFSSPAVNAAHFLQGDK